MTAAAKAVCWELEAREPGDVRGYRFAVAERFMLVQVLSRTNTRMPWKVYPTDSNTLAAEWAVQRTADVEDHMGGVLVVPPGAVLLHESEVRAVGTHRQIPPALRARIFTYCFRNRAQ
jgi:hypothetical protein